MAGIDEIAQNNLSYKCAFVCHSKHNPCISGGSVGCKTWSNMEKKGSLTSWTYRMADSWTSSNVRDTSLSVFYETLEGEWLFCLHPYGKP